MNNRDRNFTKNKIASRLAHLEADVERYIDKMVRIDRQEEGEARAEKVQHLARRYGRIRQEIARLKAMDRALANTPDGQISLTDPMPAPWRPVPGTAAWLVTTSETRRRYRDPHHRHP